MKRASNEPQQKYNVPTGYSGKMPGALGESCALVLEVEAEMPTAGGEMSRSGWFDL